MGARLDDLTTGFAEQGESGEKTAALRLQDSLAVLIQQVKAVVEVPEQVGAQRIRRPEVHDMHVADGLATPRRHGGEIFIGA
jgi:hypothetical protein